MAQKVQFTETVLRDANQSLMATRMAFSDMEGILSTMDKAGYYSVECWGGATFDSCLRYLDEDPWERLRAFRKAMPNTRLQMLLRGQNLLGYKHYHDDVVEKFVELSIKNPPSYSGASACSSWQILQTSVPEKYYLSPAVCSRILRLAAKAGCPPPAEIEYLLLKQGGRYPSCVPSSSGGCGQWQSRAIKKVSARVSAETANPSQLCLPV